jgi:S-adenosylmethionine:tRNA ribosyltransferase-isomerase
MLVSEFDYPLPPELIAQQPAPQRTASRLLHVDARSGTLRDLAFGDFPELVDARDTVVLNDTRVIKARLTGKKRTGGKVEVFVERAEGARQGIALIRASHPPPAGTEILVGSGVVVTVQGREQDMYRVAFSADIHSVLEQYGEVPLPPYIRHEAHREDAERYQTVYARQRGAVAAPTAGLHFDEALLKRVEQKGAKVVRLTLHVGSGTFQPVRGEVVEDHRMHSERYAIPSETMRAVANRRVLAVGTTTLRALESHALSGKASGETDLFITPGFEFKVVRRLLTNFHLPRSTLLMLVSAFAGRDLVFEAYRHAIEKRYRFFSYGDAMLIER